MHIDKYGEPCESFCHRPSQDQEGAQRADRPRPHRDAGDDHRVCRAGQRRRPARHQEVHDYPQRGVAAVVQRRLDVRDPQLLRWPLGLQGRPFTQPHCHPHPQHRWHPLHRPSHRHHPDVRLGRPLHR